MPDDNRSAEDVGNVQMLAHDVRSFGHPMYRRPLANRTPSVNFFACRKGNEAFLPG